MGFIKAGISPEQLAVALSLGVVVGLIPLFGSTTLICFILAFTLRLNMAALQLVSYLMFPFQLLLFIPFFQAGGYLFEPLEVPISVDQISEMISTNFWGTIQQFWFANLQALLVWLILAIPSFILLYFVLLQALRKLSLAFVNKNP